MYCNIGNKIKVLAVILAVAGALACVAAGVVILRGGDLMADIAGTYSYTYAYPRHNPSGIVGWVVIIAGPVVCWVNSFMLYGYGELIAQTQRVNRRVALIENLLKKQKEPAQQTPANAPGKRNTWTCPACGNVNDWEDDTCIKCGKY